MPKRLLLKTCSHFTHYRGHSYFAYLLLTISFVLTLPVNSYSANIEVIPKPDSQSAVFSIQIDKAEKLAGLKISLDYPKNNYSYKETKKGVRLNSFMHVVNDKIPGKLVVVMASAKGISGKDITLFQVKFSSETTQKKSQDLPTLTTCELMSEDLLSIPCNLQSAPANMPQTSLSEL